MFRMVVQDAFMGTAPNRTLVVFYGPCENLFPMPKYLRDSSGRVISVMPPFHLSRDGFASFATYDLPDAESIIGLELFAVPREEWPEQ